MRKTLKKRAKALAAAAGAGALILSATGCQSPSVTAKGNNQTQQETVQETEAQTVQATEAEAEKTETGSFLHGRYLRRKRRPRQTDSCQSVSDEKCGQPSAPSGKGCRFRHSRVHPSHCRDSIFTDRGCEGMEVWRLRRAESSGHDACGDPDAGRSGSRNHCG